jgi:glycosyltransferase involved in cell wall biosynthesis
MARKVIEVSKSWTPDLILAFTFVTAPYTLKVQEIPRVIDIDNFLTYYLYEEYLLAANFVQRSRHWLAWRKFQRFESQLFQRFDLCLVVSSRDAQLIQSSCKVQPERVTIIPNGADVEAGWLNAIPVEENTLIFNGSLRYTPNLDAMHYFLQEIFPLIKTREPNAKLIITGKTEGVPLERLPQCDEHVRFTVLGRVHD